ncbi:unnamed protein product [Durusdinium trenchii]|uniref:A-kinase anchor protein 7-like phosphoesterase domain-containing protein n=2 Tax=Durusdinium trenchii TaxID=1381693 RepID=A0ABP0LH52_9DINO
MDPFENAALDPWSGKSLGEVEKPEGFDAFWHEQEAVQRGEKEPPPDLLAGGEETGKKGKGKGKGKGGKGRRNSRYNVVARPPPRARPSHFVAIRLFSRMIRRNVQQMQQWFIAKNPLFEQCLVPVRRLHSSLLLTAIPPERRGEAQEACHEAGEEIRDFLGDQPVKIVASGISSFNGQILFTRLRTEPHDMLQAIHDALSSAFMRHGFPVLDESAKSWLEEGEEPHDFKAHASFIKVSKAMAHAKSDADKRKFRSLRLASDDLDAWRDVFFGTQICTEFELLDMIGSSRDGYYPCLQLEHFHDRTVMVSEPNLDVSLAAGPVRTAKLRVDQQAGAGLQLSACEAGYLVEELDPWPGQSDLRAGDVIVAIGEELLIGLSEAKVEEEFGKHFENGALTIVGPLELLQQMPLDHVRRAANRLLRPWRDDRGSVGSVGSVLVTSPAGVPRGKRHRFRVTAQEFRPDPLNQPGGDPWANAAAKGYVYPEYTGWGTKFKKRKATVVDSSRFLSKPKAVHVDEHGFFENKELTKVHQRLHQSLRRANSQEKVLSIIKEEKGLLSTSNRVVALTRLASLDRSAECTRDPRVDELLKDLLEDLEAIEESQVTLPPPTMASLALGMARLGLRHPEIFRCLGQVVRRSGLWSFADNEAASLLEGFSRARRCDEVLFQEASRLIMARMDWMEPKALTTMMTAFACANLAIETLFFAVGDCVLRRIEHGEAWSLRPLAELADAFARVRMRHALLLDVVPGRCEKAIPSVEALVLLFSAYVDSRQGFGPAELRDALARQLLERQGELSATLMRRLLQAAARARWPSHALLEAASQVALREPSTFEIDAMFDCFLQLRVVPPADFPISAEKKKQREERLKAREERQRRWKEKQGEGAEGEVEALEEASLPDHALRTCRLRVERDVGAGLELEACGAGYLVVDCLAPEQSLRCGDIIVAIERRVLIDLSEEDVEENFGAEFCDGAALVVGTFEELQHFSLRSIRRKASDLAGGRADAPEASPAGPAGPGATGCEGPPSKLCSPRAPRSAASAADAAASSTVTEPVAEVPRAVRGRRGKHGVRSTLEENEGSREDVERKRTADTNTGDREGDKERRNEPKGAGSTGSMEKKSYYQAPAKGQGSGQRVWRPKV